MGKNLRFFIVDCTPWAEEDPACADYKRAFVNAEIYEYSAETKTYNEGCLSFPGIYADVPRSLTIRSVTRIRTSWEHDEEFTGLKAWVIQHEYDHIEGKVFTDRISSPAAATAQGQTVEPGERGNTVAPTKPDNMKKFLASAFFLLRPCWARAA